jgi:hypothetical protein
MVEIGCISCSFESWEPQTAPTPWHSRAGGGAVHSITFGLMRRSDETLFNHLFGDSSREVGNSRRCDFSVFRLSRSSNLTRGSQSAQRYSCRARPRLRSGRALPCTISACTRRVLGRRAQVVRTEIAWSVPPLASPTSQARRACWRTLHWFAAHTTKGETDDDR